MLVFDFLFDGRLKAEDLTLKAEDDLTGSRVSAADLYTLWMLCLRLCILSLSLSLSATLSLFPTHF